MGYSQYNPSAPWNANVPKDQLNDYKKEVERATAYWKTHDPNVKGSGHKPYKRWETNWASQLNADGTLFSPQQLWQAWDEKNSAKRNRSASALALPPSNWEPIGPKQNALNNTRSRGRVNIIEVHPTNPNIIYMGTPAGGLWKTVNGGVNWLPLTDELPQIGVSGIAIDYTNPDVIYIATGDKDASDTYSIGVMKSINGGATWSTTGLTFASSGTRAGDLIMHPTNNQIILCATSTGLYRTLDGGVTWTNEQTGNFAQGTIRFKPNDATIVYATTLTAFYRSTNTADTFTPITAGFGIGQNANTGRRLLDVSAASPDVVYVFSSTPTDGLRGIYKSTNAGVNFTRVDPGTDILEATQSWYDFAFCVSQSDSNLIFTGCLNVWKSLNGGTAVTRVSQWNVKDPAFTHADIHFLKEIGGKIYCGSDGGIFVSTDNGVTFTEINGDAQTNQFYRISVAKQSSARVSGGAQDNGGWAYNSNLWYGYHSGDGMDSAISPIDMNTVYGFSQYGGFLNISYYGGTSLNSSVAAPTTEPQGNWIVPLRLNSVGEVYAGFSKLCKLVNGAWVAQTSTGTGAANIDHIKFDPTNDNIVYIVKGNVLYKSVNGGTSFTTLYTSSQNISSIEINNLNNTILYLTQVGVSGLVMKSIDGGTTFTSFGTGLPSVPKNIIVHQGRNTDNPLYLGTELGVYYIDDSMTSWQPFDTNLPNSPVKDLEINLEEGKLIAGTYGRGVWQTNIPLQTPNVDLSFVSLNSPTSTFACSSNMITPQITVKNNGSTTITSVTTNYTLDATPYSNTWNGTILAGQNQIIDLPSVTTTKGSHKLTVTSTTTSDAYADNNKGNGSFYINDAGTIGANNPFTTAATELIVVNDSGDGWKRGDRTTDALATAGNTAYLTNLSGSYPDRVKSNLISQCYNLNNISNPQISFKLAYSLEPNWDIVYVQYSTDFGANWSLLGTSGPGWYNSNRTPLTTGTDCNNCPGGQWTGANTTMTTYTYPLAAFNTQSNIIFRVVFHSDENTVDLGVKIDDFVISGVLASDSFEMNQIEVYPNPSTGVFNLNLNNVEAKNIEIYDVTGKLIKKMENKSITQLTQIDLSNASNGIYFVKISTENDTVTKRIIKN